MPQTETLQITLPVELVERIRARVRAGEFASESEAIAHDLLEADEFSDLPEESLGGTLDAWLEREIPARLARLDRDDGPLYTPEKAFEQLEARIRPLRSQR